jgi:large subunit ribosomal protein L6
MSRIGKQPVTVPSGIDVTIDGNTVRVKGPKGELVREFHQDMQIRMEDGSVIVERPSESGLHRSLHGLTRSLIANMVEGVSNGFSKNLEIVGVGYRAENKPFGLTLNLGFSHPIDYKAPEGITLKATTPTAIEVSGPSKELVGQVAAEIRGYRPPEPYKGKGVRYQGEAVRRKAGKAGAK